MLQMQSFFLLFCLNILIGLFCFRLLQLTLKIKMRIFLCKKYFMIYTFITALNLIATALGGKSWLKK